MLKKRIYPKVNLSGNELTDIKCGLYLDEREYDKFDGEDPSVFYSCNTDWAIIVTINVKSKELYDYCKNLNCRISFKSLNIDLI